jgi:preprotein translocase subunit SecD
MQAAPRAKTPAPARAQKQQPVVRTGKPVVRRRSGPGVDPKLDPKKPGSSN